MKRLFLLIVAAAFTGVSCERHDFEETKELHHHGDHHDQGHDHDHDHSH